MGGVHFLSILQNYPSQLEWITNYLIFNYIIMELTWSNEYRSIVHLFHLANVANQVTCRVPPVARLKRFIILKLFGVYITCKVLFNTAVCLSEVRNVTSPFAFR